VSPPNRQTVAGQAYLDLRSLARKSGRPTEELLVLYALEGFLDRLAQSPHRDQFVLKGGVLLAAYDSRRATRDIDFAARAIQNDVEDVMSLVAKIMRQPVDDGITFNAETLSTQTIRDDDEYSGVRVTATASLATATLHFHLDINIGDPIWPAPLIVSLPRLLSNETIQILGYPLAMILAEKLSPQWRVVRPIPGGVTSSISTHFFRPATTKTASFEQRSNELLSTEESPSNRLPRPSLAMPKSHKLDGQLGDATNVSKPRLRNRSAPCYKQSSTLSTLCLVDRKKRLLARLGRAWRGREGARRACFSGLHRQRTATSGRQESGSLVEAFAFSNAKLER
jgi:hypothetical protein